MSADLFRTFGPWALVLLSMAAMLKYLVVDKLVSIQATLTKLLEGHSDHESRLVRVETIMKLKGLMEPE